MPHFDEDVSDIITLIPADKLLLLDKSAPKLQAACAAVYQDFRKDIESALAEGEILIKKYRKLNRILGKEHFQYVPAGIIRGAGSFCTKKGIAIEGADKPGGKRHRGRRGLSYFLGRRSFPLHQTHQ